MMHELTAGDLLYGFLLSAHSTGRMYRMARERAAYRYRRKCAIDRLVDEQYIERKGDRLFLTNFGRSALGILSDSTRKLLGKARWDKKWRIVTFDVPERHAHLRRKVRSVLQRAGFAQLQKSVWIFPHDCEELAQLIREESRLSPHILYGVLERIDNENALKKLFDL